MVTTIGSCSGCSSEDAGGTNSRRTVNRTLTVVARLPVDDECSNDSKSSRLRTGKHVFHDRSIDEEHGIDCTVGEGIFFIVVSTCLDLEACFFGEWAVTMKATWVLHCNNAVPKNQPVAWGNQPTGDPLEQPIGTHAPTACEKPTHQLATWPTNRLVQVSDPVERSTSFSGNDSVIQKKQKLDLSAILAGVPKGCCGRSIGGADMLYQRMLKNPHTASDASELKTHLDLVRLCRTMQPTKIDGRAAGRSRSRPHRALRWAYCEPHQASKCPS